jgi:hypothetical protein
MYKSMGPLNVTVLYEVSILIICSISAWTVTDEKSNFEFHHMDLILFRMEVRVRAQYIPSLIL